MITIIIAFGTLMLLAGIVIVISPETIFGFLRVKFDKPVLHIMAVVVRLIIGGLLISQSDISRFPLVIEILGWIFIVAALLLAIMGRTHFKRLMSWALSLMPFARVGGVFAVAFGGFLVYAFL